MNHLKHIYIGLIALICLNSCNQDDDNSSKTLIGNGKVTLEFENGFGGLGDIVLNNTTKTSANNQKHQFSTLKYIISNVVLIKEDGTEVKYNYNNPDLGAFIIDQEEAVGGINKVVLTEIPEANYTKIKIGLGISHEAYLLGENGQASFWTKATAEGMKWTWAAGYIFIKLEGLYGTTTPNTQFANHIGNFGNITANNTANVYREITLNLPTSAKVRIDITPDIHFKVDLNKFLDGFTPVILSTTNDNSHGSTPELITVADNLTQAFSVDHVHND